MSGGLEVAATVAARDFDVAIKVGDGEVLAVLGPNGAGKSTLLAIIAGLIRPDTGFVRVGDRLLTDRSSGIAVAPHRRSVGLLAQEPLLFPQLTAAANVAFGPRSQGVGRLAARRAARQWLAAVDAFDMADRKPGQLSGGQAQRVAVARALAADPEVLLLDEPFAALDAKSAPALRTLLRGVLASRARAVLLVTHDIVDALTLADRIVVLESGRVSEQGAVRAVLARPRSAFAAKIAGLNLLLGTATDTGLADIAGTVEDGCVPGHPAAAVFSPAAVAIYPDQPGGSPRNVFAVRIAEVEARGSGVRVYAGTGLMADITAAAAADLDLDPGRQVYFVVKASEVAVYPHFSGGHDGLPLNYGDRSEQ